MLHELLSKIGIAKEKNISPQNIIANARWFTPEDRLIIASFLSDKNKEEIQTKIDTLRLGIEADRIEEQHV